MSVVIYPEPSECIEPGGVKFKHADLLRVVKSFYTRVQADQDLKIPFASVEHWPEHIDRLTHFWWAKFGGRPYMETEYDPVGKHFRAGFNEFFLERWLNLFHHTLSECLTEPQALLWKTVSERMGQSLLIRNDYLKKHFE